MPSLAYLLDKIFDSYYGNDSFNNLINDYCLKDDQVIKKFILEITEKVSLLVNSEEYLNNYIDEHYDKKYLDMLQIEYLKIIQNKIIALKDLYNNITPYISEKINKELINWLKPLFNGKTYEDYILFKNKSSVRFSKLPDEAITIKEELKEKTNEIKELLRFIGKEEIINNIIKTKENTQIIIDIVKEFISEINKYKNNYNVYEFNDISHMLLKIIKSNETVRNEIKYSFNEIMIDEYQDTSNIQEEFINCIENNNVYMVGDIKQSIYRFRNANPYIFENKYKKYSRKENGLKIDLLKNFRSRKEPLNSINEIFNLIMDNDIGNANYQEEHNMIYGNIAYDKENTTSNYNMEIYNYNIDESQNETPEEKELFIISKDIKDKIDNKYQVYDKDKQKLRNITYSDICIITDRNKYLPLYKKILEYHEIPSVIYMDETLTNDTIILILKNLITLVVSVQNNDYGDFFKYAFTSIARSFLFEYSDDEIYQILTNKQYKKTKIVSLAKQIDINNPLIEVINNITETYSFYEKLTKLKNIEKNIVSINNLINIASSLNDMEYNIKNFIDYLNDSTKMDLSVKYSLNTNSNNAVKIMNIHKSKGLEFSCLYFTGMHNKFTVKDVTSKYIFSTKYGIILPYKEDSELNNTIVRDIYTNDYYNEEISEKIRLFYVALTRCREKMIILANLNQDIKKYINKVPSEIRIKYRSFLDILNSIDVINKYIVNKDIKYDKNYYKTLLKEIKTDKNNIIPYTKKDNNITYQNITNEHFSKVSNNIFDIETLKLMEYGTKIHEILEYEDFKNSNNIHIQNLLKQIDKSYINIYHEYEFTYNKNNKQYHGIIDLMLEYDNYISIIDFKLQNIDDKEYIEQLNGYKNYIMQISSKNVKIYLYSITNNVLKEINYEK